MRPVRLASIASFLLLLCTGTAQARGGMPNPLTESGRRIEGLYYNIYVAGLLVFIFVFVLLVFVLWRYREKGGKGRATYEHEREHLGAEITWTVIPLIIVMWVGWISYGGLLDLEDSHPNTAWLEYPEWVASTEADRGMELAITGSQWNWEANYGDGVRVFASPDGKTGKVDEANYFHVPAGIPIRMTFTSLDVIHAFYIQDSNGGPVGMVDANPGGPHKYTHLVRTFEPGEYRVQCKEMCLNPGHGYMRAHIVAEPLPIFENWFAEKRLEGMCGSALITKFSFTLEEGIASPDAPEGNLTATKDACVIAKFDNRGEAATVDFGGFASLSIEAGATANFIVNLTAAGERAITAGDSMLRLRVIEAIPVSIELNEYLILPPQLTVEAGKTYLFQVKNTGGQTHNIFIGTLGGTDTIKWKSADIGPGGSTSFLIQPTETVTFDTWCNISGHLSLGMKGIMTVK
jgi:heme/copper-type cytochrome/quinol oxidase subunit 2/uncharacterized cupredoxin-like copper-binding protein